VGIVKIVFFVAQVPFIISLPGHGPARRVRTGPIAVLKPSRG
jgi:hypothetical protein